MQPGKKMKGQTVPDQWMWVCPLKAASMPLKRGGALRRMQALNWETVKDRSDASSGAVAPPPA